MIGPFVCCWFNPSSSLELFAVKEEPFSVFVVWGGSKIRKSAFSRENSWHLERWTRVKLPGKIQLHTYIPSKITGHSEINDLVFFVVLHFNHYIFFLHQNSILIFYSQSRLLTHVYKEVSTTFGYTPITKY